MPDSLKQRRAFTIDDAEALRERCPSLKAIAPFKWAWSDITLGYRGRTARSTFTYGTNENYLITHGYDLARGRFFTQEEVVRRENVVVLGKDTREALFKDASGLGERVHLNGIPFTVIGEFEKRRFPTPRSTSTSRSPTTRRPGSRNAASCSSTRSRPRPS